MNLSDEELIAKAIGGKLPENTLQSIWQLFTNCLKTICKLSESYLHAI